VYGDAVEGDEEDDGEGFPGDEDEGNDQGEEGEAETEGAAGQGRARSGDVDAAIAREDRLARLRFRKEVSDGTQRVLFVVPSEPLVWQVASYFSRLLKEEGDDTTKVALVTDQMTYNPLRSYGIMPQIVVGTPQALESALTKPRGVVGRFEYNHRAAGDVLPGGYDHFDWAIFDEVHALDGEEGEALQRLIRGMSCKFLALSATVGNADQLRGWMERVKGDQLVGVECIDVADDDVTRPPPPPPKTPPTASVSVQVQRYLEKITVIIEHLTPDTTVAVLKQKIGERWPSLDAAKQQLTFNGVDLALNDATLESYGLFGASSTSSASASASASAETAVPLVTLYSHVNMIQHQVRFINLQRYVWTNGSLKLLSPLAAVDDVASLREGVLGNSSLSMTSRDSMHLYEAMQKVYPATAIADASPYNFFCPDERITLQRTKDYEDVLKSTLGKLAADYPVETHELLYNFSLQEPSKEFDLCDLALELKAREMLPCLMFHLNAFEAIRLFKTLLAGLEWRQKRDVPTFYKNMTDEKEMKQKESEAAIKSKGKNAKAIEEAEKAGEITTEQDFSVDPYEPHPDYRFCKAAVMSSREWSQLSERMEREDGFNNRDRQAIKENPGQNQAILEHALMRGLRRGIGLYIKEVSSPAYRREVQRLASKGRLAVVVSDDSLAFGVNMPFRTCVFCGEMQGELTPLMAQQMSGRAGRRGLDTQGNLVYAGSRSSFIRSLMMGKVSEITGSGGKPPLYESLFLQPMLSARYVGWGRGEVIGGKTLEEYCTGGPEAPLKVPNYTLSYCKQALVDLCLIEQSESGGWQPHDGFEVTHASLSMVWELRNCMHESITLGQLLPELCRFMEPEAHNLSEKRNQERIVLFVSAFFAVLLQLLDRQEFKPRMLADGSGVDPKHVPMHEHPYFAQEDKKQLLQTWEGHFKRQQVSSLI
jgi:hypothetical protein